MAALLVLALLVGVFDVVSSTPAFFSAVLAFFAASEVILLVAALLALALLTVVFDAPAFAPGFFSVALDAVSFAPAFFVAFAVDSSVEAQHYFAVHN